MSVDWYGTSAIADASGDGSDSTGHFNVSPSVDTTFELRHQCETVVSTYGFGAPSNFTGIKEVYAQVKITKL